MTIQIAPEEFRSAFEKAWAALLANRPTDEIETAFSIGGSRWTRVVLGDDDRTPSATRSSLLALVVEELAKQTKRTIQLDRERHKVDAFLRVRRPSSETQQDAWYAEHLNVCMIEVENDPELSIEEFWKLVHYRVPLKVLITYDYSERDTRYVCLRQYEDLYEDARKALGDDPTKYLVVFGGRKDEANKKSPIAWRFFPLCGPEGNRFNLSDIEREAPP